MVQNLCLILHCLVNNDCFVCHLLAADYSNLIVIGVQIKWGN